MGCKETAHRSWDFIVQLVTAVQVGTLAWNPDFKWADDLRDGLDGVSKVRLDVTDDGFTTLFVTLAAIILAFVALSVVLTLLDCSVADGPLDEFIWFAIGDLFLFGIFLIPTLELSFEMLHCVDRGGVSVVRRAPSIECWAGDHHFYAFLAILTILVLVVGGSIKATFQNERSHEVGRAFRVRNSVSFYDSRVQVSRMLATVVSVYAREDFPILAAFLLLFVALAPPFYVMIVLPFLEPIKNVQMVAFMSLSTWMLLMGAVAALVNDPEASWVAFLTLAGIVWVGFFVALTHMRAKHFVPPECDAIVENRFLDKDYDTKQREKAPQLSRRLSIDESKVPEIVFHGPKGLCDWIEAEGSGTADFQGLVLRSNRIVQHVDTKHGLQVLTLEEHRRGKKARNSAARKKNANKSNPASAAAAAAGPAAAAESSVVDVERQQQQEEEVPSESQISHGSTGLSTQAVDALVELLHRNRELSLFSLDGLLLHHAEDIARLADALAGSPGLRWIDLVDANLQNASAMCIAEKLCRLPQLGVLRMAGNEIDADTREHVEQVFAGAGKTVKTTF